MPLENLWTEFSVQFLPDNAPDMQRRQLRIAFFAGAASALQIIGTTLHSEPRRNELLDNMTALQMELGASAMSERMIANYKPKP
jgi:hypothetical protein